MVPCALLIENRGGGYQLRPLEESTPCDSRDSVIPSTSPSLDTLHLYGTFYVMRGTIVHEDLTDIRRRVRARRGAGQRRLHAWSFAQWRQFVVYKAEEAGLDVVAIDPRHASQTCSHCGFKHWANRRSQALFQCRHCGYTLHADLSMAKHIAAEYRASRGISSAGAPLSTGVSSPLPRQERDTLPPLGDGR